MRSFGMKYGFSGDEKMQVFGNLTSKNYLAGMGNNDRMAEM